MPRFRALRSGSTWKVFLLFGTLHGTTLFAATGPSTLTELKQLNVEDLMSLEVTSVTKHPERLLDSASAIQVITQAQIRRSGATSLPEALRLADNLQVAQRGSHTWAISARGFNSDLANKLLVMIDGRTVYTPLFSGVFWEAQDYLLQDIDRIEVISGPGGTLWGSNAVNGVINIITRNAADTQGLYARVVPAPNCKPWQACGTAGRSRRGSISGSMPSTWTATMAYAPMAPPSLTAGAGARVVSASTRRHRRRMR